MYFTWVDLAWVLLTGITLGRTVGVYRTLKTISAPNDDDDTDQNCGC